MFYVEELAGQKADLYQSHNWNKNEIISKLTHLIFETWNALLLLTLYDNIKKNVHLKTCRSFDPHTYVGNFSQTWTTLRTDIAYVSDDSLHSCVKITA